MAKKKENLNYCNFDLRRKEIILTALKKIKDKGKEKI